MLLSHEATPVIKQGEFVRYRLTAENGDGIPHRVTVVFGGHPVTWEIPPYSMRRLGGAVGFVLPSAVSVAAFTDGDKVSLSIK